MWTSTTTAVCCDFCTDLQAAQLVGARPQLGRLPLVCLGQSGGRVRLGGGGQLGRGQLDLRGVHVGVHGGVHGGV